LGKHQLPKSRFIEFGFNNFHTHSSFSLNPLNRQV
jgi:hypothetical protein